MAGHVTNTIFVGEATLTHSLWPPTSPLALSVRCIDLIGALGQAREDPPAGPPSVACSAPALGSTSSSGGLWFRVEA